ncbi:branched-chain amino acid ABC transporter permease [Pseudorhodoferax sp. Leaf274]|uniref:branched-chain amino acid ABC transporter permease n=1 Tax=Pseudorhodoferax sp. Leaf274 TaxID=1736318 RepID=UPI000703355A|nr:branched-chain amino acid ABC transporter permease [Pseudorhodoferax sp. Leaf274]KQP36222.1 ABC transporter permease [Pseudorhodoferax sp. Leaf274]
MILLTTLFNGLAYGILLFVMAVGLSITMGMMRFVNLAHVSLCMLGGYVSASAMELWGLPFLATLPLAFVATALFSVALERLVLRHFYGSDDLTQVLLTIGLVFMSVSAAAFVWGPSFKPVEVPAWLTGRAAVAGLELERYRLFLLAVGALLTVAIFFGLERTRFGAMVRACVDNRRAASACGLDTHKVFALTFAIGGGLAGLGGALSASLLGLDPNFPFRYLVYMLIVVSVGGMGTILGSLAAALFIGVADVASKYYLPAAGGSVIYLVTVAVMLWRPEGLLGRKGRHA